MDFENVNYFSSETLAGKRPYCQKQIGNNRSRISRAEFKQFVKHQPPGQFKPFLTIGGNFVRLDYYLISSLPEHLK